MHFSRTRQLLLLKRPPPQITVLEAGGCARSNSPHAHNIIGPVVASPPPPSHTVTEASEVSYHDNGESLIPRQALDPAGFQLQLSLPTDLPGCFFPLCQNRLFVFCKGEYLPYESTTTFKVQTLDGGSDSQAQSWCGNNLDLQHAICITSGFAKLSAYLWT